MAELEREFADEFAATAASTFRASSNISVTNSLYHYYALMTGRAVVQTAARTAYIDTTMHAGLREMDALLHETVDGLLLPQRRKRPGDRSGGTRHRGHGVPRALLSDPGAVGAVSA